MSNQFETQAASSPPWHVQTAAQAAEALAVSPQVGLSQAEADERLAKFGPNQLYEGGRKHPLVILGAQFASPLVVVLIAAAVISVVVSDVKDAVVITAILLVNGVVGFIQEYRADEAMAALKRLSAPSVTVRREGEPRQVPAAEVSRGDVVLLDAGDLVPCDGRLAVAASLRVDESSLTGESVPVEKSIEPHGDPLLPVADRANMVFRGTAVVHGRGEMLATATGMDTELGHIAADIAGGDGAATPLQRRLAGMGKALAVGAVVVCAVIFALGLLRHEPVKDMLMTAIAMAVAAIPEGLPAVVTIALALGARRMARKHALIRSLPAVEALGSVTVICSDKTGTLTKNEMTVTDIVAEGQTWHVSGVGCLPRGTISSAGSESGGEFPPGLTELLTAGVLCNDATIDAGSDAEDCRATGDPTEVALVTLAMKAQLDPAEVRSASPRVDEHPFDSETKRMATVHRANGGQVVYVKGAPEAILPACARAHWRGDVIAMSDGARRAAEAGVQDMAARGRRILAIARRDITGRGLKDVDLDGDLTLLGLVGIIDPARPEARASIQQCHTAGIRTVMITGDHKLTAKAVANETGLMTADAEIIDGPQLDAMSEEDLLTRAEHIGIYARVSPEHKLRIVRALQAQGHVVAMTGDGVNDGPALKRADIGVAMGVTGTDVAREAASMVLADDNFATIVAAVEEGRVIFDNLRKFVRFLLTTNLAEVFTILVALLVGWPVPLLPLQILFLNLVTDGLPALALGVEPGEKDVMAQPPRGPAQGIFGGGMIRWVLMGSMLMTALVLLVMGTGVDLAHQRTIAFTALAFAQLANCVALRSERRLVVRIGVLTNPAMAVAIFVSVVAQLLVVYVPTLQKLFHTVALSASELWLCVGVALLVGLMVEAGKLLPGVRQKPSEH